MHMQVSKNKYFVLQQDISDENNVTENSLELVSLSDDDKQPKIKRKSHIVITEQNCDTSGKCYALQVGLTVDTTDDSYESDRSTTFQWETTKCFIKNRRNVNAENSDNSDSSEAIRLPLHDMKSYRKKRITVSPVLTSSRRVVSHPRKTSGNRSTIKRKQPPVVSKSREPRKIVCDMFGVKTTNYFYSPDPDSGDQTCAKIQVRCSTLSDSEESLSPRNDDSKTSENQSTVKCKQAHPVVSQNREPVRIECLRLSDSDSDSDAQS